MSYTHILATNGACSGEIPLQLGNLHKLIDLFLANNELAGEYVESTLSGRSH